MVASPVTVSTSPAPPAPAVPAPGPLRVLTADERRTYEEQGFVVVPDVFPSDELEAIDRECDRLVAEGQADSGHRAGWIMQIAEKSGLAARFAEDERLLSLVQDVVRPGLAIHSTKLVTKLPHNPEVCHWHQDEAFYLKAHDPETHSRVRMSVWVPLQDADERNGCLWLVPGSHRWGIDDWTWQAGGTCQKRINRHEYADRHALAVPVGAGSAVLFSAWTWHHSKNNATDRIRRAFIVSYQEATVTKGAGEQWKILRPAT